MFRADESCGFTTTKSNFMLKLFAFILELLAFIPTHKCVNIAKRFTILPWSFSMNENERLKQVRRVILKYRLGDPENEQ